MLCIMCRGATCHEYSPVDNGVQSKDSSLAWPYQRCSTCDLVFREPQTWLSVQDEESRYKSHQIDSQYRNYMQPVIDRVRAHCRAGECGLDYGSGPQPVLASYLRECGFQMQNYDVFFAPAQPQGPFDFITCIEAVEHFHNPIREFDRFKEWLKPGGYLLLQTQLRPDEAQFRSWYYRRDPTHVVFYSQQSLCWWARQAGFDLLEVNSPYILLQKQS